MGARSYPRCDCCYQLGPNTNVLLAVIRQIADLSIIRGCLRQAGLVECDGATRLPSQLRHTCSYAPSAKCQLKEDAGLELNR